MLRLGLGRLLHLNDAERIETYRAWLSDPRPPKLDGPKLTSRKGRLARMLTSQLFSQGLTRETTLSEALDRLWQHPAVLFDLRHLMEVLASRIPHLQPKIHGRYSEAPLRIHAAYSKLEILAAFEPADLGRSPTWMTGVRNAKQEGADLLAFTLDKSSSGFSPTTRYRDYAISRDLLHWESQSVTREASETGQRYQNHDAMDRSIMLFARERASSRAFWFLGPAHYVRHEGERPMAINWRLEHPLPGDLFAAFAAAVA